MSPEQKAWVAKGWPQLQRDWIRRRIRVRRAMGNSQVEVKKGHAGIITAVRHKRNIHIDLDACGDCGARPSFSKVWWRDLEMIE